MLNNNNKKKIMALFLFSMIFLTVLIQNNLISNWNNETNLDQETSGDEQTDLGNIKTNEVLTDTIRINGSATGVGAHNWTWAQKPEQGYVTPGGNGSQANPYVIENLVIDGQNSHGGIEIVDSRWQMASPLYFRIENNIIYNIGALNSYSAGIKLYKTQHGTVTNNNISSSRDGNYGIHIRGDRGFMFMPPYMDSSKDINVTENTVTNTEIGIYIEEACEDIKVSENTVQYNSLAGIQIAHSCVNIEITKNDASQNDVFGIADTDSNNHRPPGEYPDPMYGNSIKNNTISNNKFGLYLAQTRASTISFNNISFNSINGLYISGSSWNKIVNNTIADNQDKGILMVTGPSGSFRNKIYRNEFLRNGEHAVEDTLAPSFPVMNEFWMPTYWQNNWSWYKSGITPPLIGNFWDNYTELGANAVDDDDDGVGDIPYSFYGNEDPKPKWNDGIEGHVIRINGTWNSPYNWTWASERFWCSGMGTSINPYIIGPNEHWDGKINAWREEVGISIVDSTMPATQNFIIEDITITNSTEAGIKLDNVRSNNNFIINNNISFNDGHGIIIRKSERINITDNTISNNTKTGIYMYNGTGVVADPIKIINNVITGNGDDGIYIGQNSDNNEIIENTIAYNGQYGVNINETIFGFGGFTGCNETKLYDNVFRGNKVNNARDTGTDTEWYKDTFNIKRGNEWDDYDGHDGDDDGIGDTGVYPYPVKSYDVSGSSLSQDRYPIKYDGLEENALFIDGDSMGVNAHNWTWASKRLFVSGSGTFNNPYVIENVRFNGTDSTSAITIIDSNMYFRIENCTLVDIGGSGLDSGKAGIYLSNVQYGDLINNTFSTKYDGNYGIHLSKCNSIFNNVIVNITDHVIESNTINLTYGIYLDNCVGTIDSYIVIDGNTIRNNDIGIFLNNDTRFTNITNNEITDNTYCGIYINDNSADTKIYYNDIMGNGNGTILENDAMNSNIIDNNIKDNTDFGLYVNSSGNFIYYNNFTNNGINAQDDIPLGLFNTWYKSIAGPPISGEGNYWDDYVVIMGSGLAKDADDDGIGDVEYNMTGVAKASDEYPIWIDEYNGSKIEIDGSIPDPAPFMPSTFRSWAWAASRTWCTGSGTVNDPYIISELVINGQLNGSCVYIHHSDRRFVIEGSTFYNSSSTNSPEAGGIRLLNVRNATILGNNISNNDGHGIIIRSDFSFMPMESRNIIIRDNLIKNNNGSGIYINGSEVHDNTIQNNTISLNGVNGISVTDNAYENLILGNNLKSNEEVGIYIKDFQPLLPVGHWEYPPPDYLPVWVIDPWDRNYIYNNTIVFGEIGIEIDSSYEIIISGNDISQTESNGIAIGGFGSHNITVLNNGIYYNDQAGIHLQQCFGSTFSKNTIDGNSIGISLAYSDEHNDFTDNLIINNIDRGLAIHEVSCKSNKIYRNNFTGNGMNGFDFGLLNEWYFMNTGNFWDDYVGSDSNDNGIGDPSFPYENIGGDLRDPKDYFPIYWDAPSVLCLSKPGLLQDGSEFLHAPRFNINVTAGRGAYFWFQFDVSGPKSNPILLKGDIGEIIGPEEGILIEPILWEQLTPTSHTITFYANDTQGYEGFQTISFVKLNATTTSTTSASSGGGGSSTADEVEEEGYPWYIQAAMTGAVSATAGLIIKQVYSSAKKRRIILEKIHENFAKVENLEKFLKDSLDYEAWQRLEEPWKQYQSEEITERKLIKKAKKSLGKRFTELFIPHKKSRRRTT